MMKLDNSLEQFCVQWEKWENAIIDYSKASTSKPAYLQRVLESMKEDDPGMLYTGVYIIIIVLVFTDSFTLSAFKCLSYFMVPKQRRRVETDMPNHCLIPCLLMEAAVREF